MKILLAPDKFRGSLTARQVCDAMTEGIRLVVPDAVIVALPLADGGEGTAEVLTDATNGEWHTVNVSDPLGRPTKAGFGLSADGSTAFIEMAQASGLKLLQRDEYNPFLTHTTGTGELIKEAISKGARSIVLGIGGSATNDAGMGMATALGWRFLDINGQELSPCGAALEKIIRIVPPATPLPQGLTIAVACDVTNPLYGPTGAAYIYGPQKGATLEMILKLDRGLVNFARVISEQFQVDLANRPGAGAAGGLGAGTIFFLNATLQEGVQLIMQEVHFEQHLPGTSLVLTGEGKIDEQTLYGKLLKGITRQCQTIDIPVVALCGTLDLEPEQLAQLGLTATFSVLTRPQPLEEAVKRAHADVRQATFQLMRLFSC